MKKALIAELNKIPFFKIFSGAANFIMVKLGNIAAVNTGGLAEELLRRGILIRTCGNFQGLDSGYFRIAVKKKRRPRSSSRK